MNTRPNRMLDPIVPPRKARTKRFAKAEALSPVILAKVEGVGSNG